MPTLTSLNDLLLDQLSDLLSAERQLIVALPKMAAAASGKNLRQGFLDHLAQTRTHVTRLEKAFAALGATPEAKTCLAMKGLIAEGAEAIGLKAPGTLRDVALIGAARRVEHYEIAAYAATRGLAGAADAATVADLLQQTADEECDTDKRLCSLGDLALEASKDLSPDAQGRASRPAPRKSGVRKQK